MRNIFLIIGGFLIALLYKSVTVIGAYADTYFGGKWLLPRLPQGSPLPALSSLGIAVIFSI